MRREMRDWEKDYFIEWDTFEPGSFRLCVGPRDSRGLHRFIVSRRACGYGWYVEARLWWWLHRTNVLGNSGTSPKSSMAKRKFSISTARAN